MTIDKWLKQAEKQLKTFGVATARLDCLVLVEDLLHTDRTQLLAHGNKTLASEQLKTLNAWIARRQNHEPLAYIRGRTEFYGREFVVSPDTLEPRPETETMIEMVKKLELPSKSMFADVGAGSGAIGITLVLEIPDSTVDMFEISEPAILVAQQNIQKSAETHCHIIKSDLLEAAQRSYDIVVANLPYVPSGHTINQAAMQEPKLAIFGGTDGLDLYRRLFIQIATLPQFKVKKPKLIVTESLPFQHKELAKIAKQHGYKLIDNEDFIQVFGLSGSELPRG